MEKGPEKDIARRNNVSSSTVNRILDSISKDKLIKNGGNFLEVMGIDEFKATKDTKSKMAFIIVNQDKRNIFDINNSRLSMILRSISKDILNKKEIKLNLLH